MKLDANEFKRYKELMDKKDRTADEDAELKKLAAKKKKGKGGSNTSKPNGKPGKQDPSWYKKYPELMNDAVNFVFNSIAGTPIGYSSTNARQNLNYPVVGARLEFKRVIGTATSGNDPMNYQFRKLWLELHRKYRGIGSYQYSDLGIAIYAIACAFSEIFRAERIYGLCSYFMVRNRSVPTKLLDALQVNSASITGTNLADFRYNINKIIAKCSTLCLPRGMSMLECYVKLMANVFKDSDSDRGVWFFYDDTTRIQFSGTAVSTGSACLYLDRTSNKGTQTFEQILDDLNSDIDALLNNDDIARMCSDILAAFTEKNVVTLSYMPENYLVEAIRSDDRLLQLHNTTLCGTVLGGGFDDTATATAVAGSASYTTMGVNKSLTIYQKDNVIRQKLYTTPMDKLMADLNPGGIVWGFVNNGKVVPYSSTNLTSELWSGEVFMDVWKDQVDPDTIIDGIQQLVKKDAVTVQIGSGSSAVTGYTTELNGYGIYVVESITFFTMKQALKLNSDVFEIDRTNWAAANQDIVVRAMIQTIDAIDHIDWHPCIYFKLKEDAQVEGVMIDADNYALVPTQGLSRIHDVSTLSAFKLDLLSTKE